MVTKCLPFRSDKYAKKTYWKIGGGEKEMGSFIGCVGQVKKTMSSNQMSIMRKVVSKTARKILPASSVAAATSSLSGPLPPLLYAVMTNL